MPSSMRIFRHDVDMSFTDFLRLNFVSRPLLMISPKTIDPPAPLLEEIESALPEKEFLDFAVCVNPALPGDVHFRLVRQRFKLPTLALIFAKSWMRRLEEFLVKPLKYLFRSLLAGQPDARAKRSKAALDVPPAGATSNSVGGPGRLRGLGTESKGILQHLRSTIAAWCSTPSRRFFEVPAPQALRTLVLADSLAHVAEFRFPRAIHVALTTECNLKCIMCPYHGREMRRQQSTGYFDNKKRLPVDLLHRLISEVARHRAHLSFGQYDEPFLYPDFAAIAAEAKARGCSVSITTNGTLLGEDEARQLLEAEIDHVCFSLDAATPETYSKIRHTDFRLPMENLRRFVNLRRRTAPGTIIRACMVLQAENKHEADMFKQVMRETGVDMISYYVLSKFENGIWVNEKLNFAVSDDRGRRFPCSQLWSQVAVYPDGQVALCCATTLYVGYRHDLPYVGNLHEANVADIWFGPAYRKIRREALNGVYRNSICRDCEIWHNYQGKTTVNASGEEIHQNPYETFVTFQRRR